MRKRKGEEMMRWRKNPGMEGWMKDDGDMMDIWRGEAGGGVAHGLVS